MKLKFLLIGLLSSCIVLAGEDVVRPQSVSVLNLSAKPVDLWLNGEYRSLGSGVAVLQPCLNGENVEVQINSSLSNVECGDKVEIVE